MVRRHSELDMIHGPLFSGILQFALPLMLTSVLQLLYNAADIIVLGRYAGREALAAVGSTGSLIHLMLTLFLGLGVGTSVTVANGYGARDFRAVSESVHTSVAISLVSSLAVMVFGVLASRPILTLMGTPEDVIDLSTLYMRIYFLGVPANLMYNFGSAALRSVGDTKRPLYILSLSGLLNVGLNLFFVLALDMSVDGVALATILSQYLSAALVVICLLRSQDCIRLDLRKIRFHRERVVQILRIGLPAGLQGAMFSISNVLIQSSINSFGSAAMAGASAGNNIEGFVYVMMNALHQAAITFNGQNMGAKNYQRVPKVLNQCVLISLLIYVVGSGLTIGLNRQLVSIYNSDPSVIDYGMQRQNIMMSVYFLLGGMEVFSGQLRGMGYSMLPTVLTLLGACVLRTIWQYTIFVQWHTFFVLILSYPVSWAVTSGALYVGYLYAKKRLPKGVEELGESKQ